MPGWPGGLGNRLQDLRTLIDQGLGDRLQAIQEHRAALEQGRIAQAFGAAAEGQQEPSQALYAAKHRRAQGLPPETSFLEDVASLGPRAVGGAQKMWQMAPAAAGALWNDPLGSINRAGQAGQAATDAIVQGMAKPFTQFGDPNVDPAQQGADLGLTAMGLSSVVPAEANAVRSGLGSRLQEGTWKHPISANKLRDRPYEEMTSTTAPVPGQNLQDVKPFDIGNIKEGDYVVPFLGDRTAGEGALTHVNEMPIDPVLQEGGSDYLRRPGSPLWASDPKVVGDYHKLISRLQGELPKGSSIWGATVGMGPQSLDYSLQTTKTLLNMVKEGAPLTKKAKKAFDDAMRKTEWTDFRAYPDWPGIDNVTDEWLKGAGSARTKIAKLMDTAKFADMGFPNVAAARKANTHPELRGDLPFLPTGHAVTRIGEGPVQHVRDPLDPHGSYRSQLAAEGSQYEGRLPRLVPGEIMFPSWARRLKPGLNESGKQRAFSMQEVAQKFTKAHLNRIGKFLDSDEGKKLGVAGLIGAGLLTADEAVGIFGTDGSEPDRPAI